MNEQTHRKNCSGFESSRILVNILLRGALIAALALSLGLFGGASLSAQMRHIELNDYAKITSVSDPQISPDGRSIVFVVSRPNLEQDRSDRELVLIDIATGAQRVLTYERKGVGSSRWSPNGDRLAFVAADGAGKDAKPQVFILSLTGGPTGKRSPTSPPTSRRTRRKSKSITMPLRSATTISSRPKRRSLLTFGFSRWKAERQSGSPPALGALPRAHRPARRHLPFPGPPMGSGCCSPGRSIRTR